MFLVSLFLNTDRSPIPNRNFSHATYRYGFNGMEKDNEVKGDGNSLDFGARIYDSRLGRFLIQDKFSNKFPNFSTYLYAGNSPIGALDVNGDSLYILAYTNMKALEWRCLLH